MKLVQMLSAVFLSLMAFLAALITSSVQAAAELSGATQATSIEPEVIIVGTPFGRGVECALLRLKSGEMITLTGDLSELRRGEAALLAGDWVRVSTCMQGRTFQVSKRLGAE